MKVITVQHKSVYDDYLSKGKSYIKKDNSDIKVQCIELYKSFIKDGKYPIFGVCRFDTYEPDIKNKIQYTSLKNLNRLDDLGARILNNDFIIMILDIPFEDLLLMDFYSWVEKMDLEISYNNGNDDNYSIESLKDIEYLQTVNIYNLHHYNPIQSIFYEIKPEYVLDYLYTDKLIKKKKSYREIIIDISK